MTPAGTRFSFTVTGTVAESGWTLGFTASDLKGGVLRVIGDRLRLGRFDLQTDETWRTETWSYRAVLQVETIIDHDSERDVLTIVEGAFWSTADARPVVTIGEYTQANPLASSSFTTELITIAVILVAGLVLVIWARP